MIKCISHTKLTKKYFTLLLNVRYIGLILTMVGRFKNESDLIMQLEIGSSQRISVFCLLVDNPAYLGVGSFSEVFLKL